MKSFMDGLAVLSLALHAAAVWCLLRANDYNAILFGLAISILLIVAVAIVAKRIAEKGMMLSPPTFEETEKDKVEFWGVRWKRLFYRLLSYAVTYGAIAYMIFGGIDLEPLGIVMLLNQLLIIITRIGDGTGTGNKVTRPTRTKEDDTKKNPWARSI